MKKSTLLLSILGLSTLSSAIIPVTSCSNTQNHVWLNSIDQPTKEADENYKAKYYFGLDTNYETKDIKVTIESDSKNVLILNYFVSNNILVVQIEYTGWVEETTKIKFNLNFSTSQWSQQIKDLVLNIQINDPIDLYLLKKINKILAKNDWCYTMNDAITLVKANGVDVENLTCKTENGIYVWDQSFNKFAIINSENGELIYGTDGYVLNQNKWELWKMIAPSEFNSYNQYSQYLKSGLTANDSTDGNYSFISGFDAGSNTNVKNVHYFYEKMEGTQTAKNIIINTNSINTTVDISAWDGAGHDGDTISHFGQSSDLTIVSNYLYLECGKVISASVCDGIVTIASDANIEMTYVRSADVKLQQYKTGTDIVYAETQAIADAIKESSSITVPSENIVDSSKYQKIKEKAIEDKGGTVQHVFTVTGGIQDDYYETWSDIAAAVNNSNTFEGLTVTLNKDYDMAAENDTWSMVGPSNPSAENIFKGTINGQGHSIINFNLTTSTADERAFFGAFNGTLKNINFVNCSNHNTNAVDASAPIVCVYPTGTATFDNVNLVNCHVSGYSTNGIFASQFYNCTNAKMINCTIDEDSSLESKYNGTTNYGYFTGGFAAQVLKTTKFTAEGCKNYATINGMHSVGGLFGCIGSSNNSSCVEAELIDCENYGKITINHTRNWGAYAAGFVGTWSSYKTVTSSLKFTNCKNFGSVDSLKNTGNEESDGLGGFIGYGDTTASTEASEKSTIKFIDCENSGDIGTNETIYKNTGAAGFCGRELTQANVLVDFNNCNNTGKVNGTVVGHYIANLKAQYITNKTCTNCTHNTGTLVGTTITKITGEPD